MLDSGTPFLNSKDIAWTAEFPEHKVKLLKATPTNIWNIKDENY